MTALFSVLLKKVVQIYGLKVFVFIGITIPFHSKDLKPETLKSILRQARIEFD